MLYFLLNWRIQTNLVQIVFKPSLVLKHDFMGVPLCPTYVSAWLPKIPEEIHPTNFTKNHVRENRVTFGGAKKTLSILVESNYEIDEEFDDSSNWSLIYMRKIHGSKSWKYIASPAKLVSTKNDEPNLQTLKWGLIKNTSSEVFPDFRHCRLLVFSGLYFLLRKKKHLAWRGDCLWLPHVSSASWHILGCSARCHGENHLTQVMVKGGYKGNGRPSVR